MIKIENLCLELNGTGIFQNLNIEITSGAKVWISGKSGSGKSTLFRLLLGFLQPQQGEIWVDGILLNAKTIWEIRQKIAAVFQESDFATGNVLSFFKQIFSFKHNPAYEKIEPKMYQLLSYFSLEKSILSKSINQISGGEKQRIALIAAILLDRKIYLLDEAFSAMEKNLQEKGIQYFLDLQETTVLFTGHNEVLFQEKNVKKIDLKEIS